ncbi:MAG: hypothetical protein P8181_09640, partial [bacterium]
MSRHREACSLLSNRLTKLCFESIFETALDMLLDKHSPARRHERREKRAAAANKPPNQAAKKSPDRNESSRRTAKPGKSDTRDIRRRDQDRPGQGPDVRGENRDARRGHGDTIPAARADQVSRKKFDWQYRSGTDIMLTNTSGEPAACHAKSRQRNTKPPDPSETPETSRHIPARTRDAVYIRDKNRCTHIGTNGKRCNETRWLQIDHIVPFAKGGTNS